MIAAWTVFCAHRTSSIWALQGIIEQAGVNELVITANSICHQDHGRPVASARGALRMTVCGKYKGWIPKWPKQRRNDVVPIVINLTAMALRFRTQMSPPPEWSLNKL